MQHGLVSSGLELGTGSDLRNPAILIVHRIAQHAHLNAEDVLIEGIALAYPKLTPSRPGVEQFMRIGQLDAVIQADRGTRAAQREVGQPDIGAVQVAAHRVPRAVAGDQRPRHQPAAARAFELADAGGGEYAATLEGLRERRARGTHQTAGGDQDVKEQAHPS